MDDARTSVQRILAEVKTFLAQEAPPRLSEADTKAHFIEPIIRALGWQGLGIVTREYYVRNSQEFIDYLLRPPGGPLLAIEAKALQAELSDKHAAQLIQYCAVEGVEWAALTNGRELQFFNTFLKPDLAAKRVLRLDLLAFNSDEEFDAIFAQVWQLSRERMTAPTGVRSWLHQRRLDAGLRGILTNPGSPAVRHLRKALGELDVDATAQEVVQWFRGHLAGAIVPLPPRSPGGNALPPVLGPTVVNPKPPKPGPTKPPAPPTAERRYLLTPIRDDEKGTARETLERLLGNGWYVFGESTPGRKALKAGDRICFYETGKGVVAEAEAASAPERRLVPHVRFPEKYPWAFAVRDVRYFFDAPVVIDAGFRARLDAFQGREPSSHWAWFVQQTHTVSAHDFALLTGRGGETAVASS